MKFTFKQKELLANFLSNIGVAWFAAGVVAPIFISSKTTDIIISGVWGLILSIFSLSFSLLVVKRK